MSTKKDLVQGQAFSRRRLVTAFVSGAPGGRELEPAKPLGAVIGGAVLGLMLVVGSIAFGYIKSGAPQGWDNNTLVIGEKSGARYVAINGTLFPVTNTASARLLIPASQYKVETVDEQFIASAKHGAPLGIPGAPDGLPAPADVTNNEWVSCVADAKTVGTLIGRDVDSTPTDDQVSIVRVSGGLQLIYDGQRLPLPKGALATSILRALSLDTAKVFDAPAAWSNLFPQGGPLSFPDQRGPGAPLPGLPAQAVRGSILTVKLASGESTRYVLDKAGKLVPLTDFAYTVYRTQYPQAAEVEVSPAQVQAIPNETVVIAPPSWPAKVPTAVGGNPCALVVPTSTSTGTVQLVQSPAVPLRPGFFTATAQAGLGAVAQVVDNTAKEPGATYLIDPSGIAYPLDSDGQPTVTNLGFGANSVVKVTAPWIGLFGTGPNLSCTAVAASATGQSWCGQGQ